jgi:predicted Rossmann fold nucleotide-binding protein DprA/Smf involved in DNA uptake
VETLSDEFASQRQLAITERFEGFINYMYPIALNIRRTHFVARDRLIAAMFEQVSMFSQAGKSGQVSKLYMADAGLADLRFMVRFLSDAKRKLISRHQAEVASIHLAETGKMLGAWIKTKSAKGERG